MQAYFFLHPNNVLCMRQALEENKLKEIKNGRLAMIAFVGFVAQHAATGKVGRTFPLL